MSLQSSLVVPGLRRAMRTFPSFSMMAAVTIIIGVVYWKLPGTGKIEDWAGAGPRKITPLRLCNRRSQVGAGQSMGRVSSCRNRARKVGVLWGLWTRSGSPMGCLG
jgi:hypothetical protein